MEPTKEQNAAHSYSEGSELPPNNETVEDGGGCYIAGSREDDILAEQNAFHLVKALDLIDECYHYLKANPPSNKTMTHAKWESLVEETDYMREFNSSADHVRNNEETELTRLRSELQQKDEVIKELGKGLESLERLYYAGYTIYPNDLNPLIAKSKAK